ncbi:MAG TPA: hypothetical protein ENG67_02410 [candidate division WOR-3 bacterium]|uniref:Uncharacterized protein n=1 Tax=candidate division WOR-3 bacterium TaxID=2052148 RepID=A0A7C1BDQ6_UNCW3|nr:hypothetical protein [candidate division WOR-3 bacterium]
MRKVLALTMIFPLLLAAQGVKITGNLKKVKVKILKEIEKEYILLERGKPLSFEVEGPVFLRVYTRLVYPEKAKGTAIYKLILEEDGKQEKIITKETEPSNKAFLDGKKLGKWRSFLIEVPPGRHTYRLGIWKSPSPEVAVRIKRTSPPVWKELPPLRPFTIITAYENEKKTNYYLLKKGESLRFRLQGPGRVKLIVRLNFDETLGEEAGFTVVVREGDKEIQRASFKSYRSEMVSWNERKDLVPGKAETLYLEVPKGEHTIQVELLGTLAPSAGVRLLIPEIKGE